MSRLIHLIKNQGLGLLALLLVLTGGAAYAATAAKDSVVSRSIKNGQVKTVDLKDGGVTTAKLAPGSVTQSQLAKDSVTGADVADSSLQGIDIENESITAADVAFGSIGGDEIQSDTLTGADIDEGSLGVVPYAEQAGTGRYGFTGSCDPESVDYVVCASLSPTLTRQGRMLVVATVQAQTEVVPDSDDMSGNCHLVVDADVYETSETLFRAQDAGNTLSTVADNGTLVAVTDVLNAGSHTITVECNQNSIGAINYPMARMVTVSLGNG